MPTGYTAALYDGPEDFQRFLFKCARAFGALIMHREDPIDAPLPDADAPSPFYDDGLAKAKARIEELSRLSDGEIASKAAEHAERTNKENALMYAEMVERYVRFVAMEAKVHAWQPPTPDHESLKSFMLEQLSHDCTEPPKPRIVSANAAEWLARQMESARWDLNYYEKNATEQRENSAARTAWIKALKESVAV